MKIKTKITWLFMAMVVGFLLQPATAGTITTVTIPSTDTFGNLVTLTLDTAAMTMTMTVVTKDNSKAGTGFGGVAWLATGVIPGSFVGFSVNGNATLGWFGFDGPASAASGGCNNSSSNSGCAQDNGFIGGTSGPLAQLNTNDVYTWVWNVTLAQTFTSFTYGHAQANFGQLEPGKGQDRGTIVYGSTGQFSVANTGVPEPSSLVLLGLGMSGLAFCRRKI